MGKKDDLDPMGAVRNIADLVNEAISSGDYSSLNRQITEALNEAADAVHDSVTGAVFGNKPFYKTEGGKTYRAESGSSYQQAQEKARHTDGLKEAREYMKNEYLANNLIDISNELLKLETNDPVEIFGHIDSKKLRSSMTLFELVSDNEVFSLVLEKYYDGKRDQKTLDLIK